MTEQAVVLGYYWGDDAYGVEHAPDRLAAILARDGLPPERWRAEGPSTNADEIAERLATAPLFGGGTLVIVSDPAPLMAGKAAAARLLATLAAIAPGNGLAFLETVDGSARRSTAGLDPLRAAVKGGGGEVREYRAPTQHEMARWIAERARERNIRISGQAAAQLAERVGAFVREGDVDRRRQGALAVSELEKLAVYRLDGEIGPDDVRALVADAVPSSTWAFLDAVGSRRAAEAAALAEHIVDELAGPVIVVHLHRRLRELLEIRELLASGAQEPSLVRTLKFNPYRAKHLAEQARRWASVDLENALLGLLDLDTSFKGADGRPEASRRMALSLWLADRVRPAND